VPLSGVVLPNYIYLIATNITIYLDSLQNVRSRPSSFLSGNFGVILC
jgi:hypothetical protein